jgi:spermidine dehydrogenase
VAKDPMEASSNKDGITRRQFLDGVAISAAGLAIAAADPWLTGAQAATLAAGGIALPPGYYPPTSTGLTGQPDHVITEILKIDGLPNPTDVHSVVGGPGISRKTTNTREAYDCVIVGAGASGVAAAKYYRDRFGQGSKILLLDPLPDFGGHSHRNEFHIPDATTGGGDVMVLRNGGTVNLDSIGTWGGGPRARSSTSRRTRPRSTSSRSAASTPTISRPAADRGSRAASD